MDQKTITIIFYMINQTLPMMKDFSNANDDTLKSIFTSGAIKKKSHEIHPDFAPMAKIVVCGVGGGGGNAINRMID